MNRSNETDTRNYRTDAYNNNRGSHNERLESGSSPRSLLRDRPLAEPHVHLHTPLVTMNGERTQQQTPLSTAGETTINKASTTNTTNQSYTSNESTTSQPAPAMTFDRNPQTVSSPPSPGRSPSFLPSIDEGSSECDYRHNNGYYYENKTSDSFCKSNGSSSSLMMEPLTSQVPSLSAASDNSSIDSCLEHGSTHSTDSSGSSDNSMDYEYENLDDNYDSVSFRSTQSLPPSLYASSRMSSTSTRRRPDSAKRSYPSFPTKQGHFVRSSSAPYSSDSSLPSSPNPFARPKIDPSSMRQMSRRQSYPPITQSYSGPKYYTKTAKPTSTKTKASSSSMNRRQCMISFLQSAVCLQLALLFIIAVLVLWSRSQAAFASDTLLRLRESESMGLLKLHRLESHSMHVHELMRNRVLRENGKSKDTDDYEDLLDGEEPQEAIDPEDDPLLDQYQQLAQMSADLRQHAAVTTLQSTIQETAIENMIDIYGEGPVKVVIELDFGDKSFIAHNNNRKARHTHDMAKGTYLSIVLWPDTPHAAWAWLEQIGRSVWDGSTIEWNSSSTLLQFQPTKDDPEDRGQIEFVEGHPKHEESNPDMHHGAWTIGLRETLGDEENKGRLEMFINLGDNQEERKHETCVGKVFDGFDALQRLLEGTDVTDDGSVKTNVTVKSVNAMHLTHKEFGQIYR